MVVFDGMVLIVVMSLYRCRCHFENESWTGGNGICASLFPLFHQIKFFYVGGNGGEQTGRPVDEPGLDRREGEGHRLLCSLHRFVSSTLSLCLKKFRDNSLANKK